MTMRVAGRYGVLRELGEGAWGRVLLVEDRLTGRRVALKMRRMDPVGTGGAGEDPGAEFRVLTRLRHPNLARVFDLGAARFGAAATPVIYFTREFVEGEDLVTALRGASPEAVFRTAVVLCHAVAAMHDQGVVHGDLSPANVLALEGVPASLRVIDFGLARLACGGESSASGIRGSLLYVAPEVLGGAALSPQSDLYALGVMLYHAAAGVPPFTGSAGELIRLHVDVAPPSLADRRPDLPPALCAVVRRLLAKDPAHRYATAWDVLRDLDGTAPTPRRPWPEPPLVGRDGVLAAVARLVRKDAPVTAVLLLGEDGSGRTRVLEALRWRLQAAGGVAAAEGALVSTGAEESPFHRPLRHLALLAGRWDEAIPLLGALDAAATPERAAAARDAAASFAARACAAVPASLLLDDLHRASDATADLVIHLARSLEQTPGVPPMVVACAPGPRADRLSSEVERVETVRLGELDAGAAGRIVSALAGRPDPALAGRVLEHAGGLPGHLVEVTRAVLEAGPAPAGSDLPIPAGLDAALRARLDRSGPAARSLLESLAACDGPAGLEEAGEDAGLLDAASFEAAARGLATAGWLREAEVGRFGFERPAVREVVLASARPKRRRALHAARAARLAPAGGAPPSGERLAAAARHLLRSRPQPGAVPRAVALALAAADERVGRGEPGWAAALLREALDAAEGTQRAAVQGALAGALAASGEYDPALELLAQAAAACTGEDRAALLVRSGEIRERKGDYAEAEEALSRAAATAATDGTRAGALEALARIRAARGDWPAASEAAASALAAGGSDAVRARAAATQGLAAAAAGRDADALGRLAAARDAASRAADPGVHAVVLGHLAIVHQQAGRLREALEAFREAAERAERSGDLGRLPAHWVNLGTAHQRLGETEPALELYRKGIALAGRMGKRSVVVAGLVNLADRQAWLGAAEEARESAGRAAELARRLGMHAFEARALLARAEAASCDSPAAGLADAERAAERFERLGMASEAVEARLVVGELLLWGEEPVRAAQAAEEALEQLARIGRVDSLRVRADLLRGESLASRGDVTGAEASLEPLIDRPEDGDLPELRWRALAALARIDARAGRPERARSRRRAADEALSTLQARVPAEHRESFVARHPARRALREAAQAESRGPGAEQRLVRLMAINRALVAERDPRRLLATALDTAVELCNAERGFLIIVGPKGGMQVEVGRNLDREGIRSAQLKVSRSIADEVARTGEPILTLNALEDGRFDRLASVRDLKLRSVLCVPIRGRDRILGTLYLDHRFHPGRFGEADLRLLVAFADVVAVALENARLLEENVRHASELERAKEALEASSATQARRLEEALFELEAAREALALKYDYSRIVGRSAAMLALLRVLDRVIETHVPVLIEGESGTGKELVARAVHYNGPRRDAPFVSVNCGALPDSLLESELFGHLRGAFTGATADRTGLFAAAHRGTLFLDEVGDTSPALQAKLLRAVQEGEIRPVGSNERRKVDVRILAATLRDLDADVRAGRFREDLLYRLNVVTLRVPPLRDRREDIPLLADHILERFAGELGGARKRLAPDALATLLKHPWPGNVRELENVLKNAAILATGETIGPESIHLAHPEHPLPSTGTTLNLDEIEQRTIERAIAAAGGNKKRAAGLLGISRLTLYRKLKRFEAPE
jgi:transcriptional regulator with GAF, ATPase, and Fis domain/tetratricopeptide (TPR) repeat protein